MNSEISTVCDRESRRFVHLGRESSPSLPWLGSPDINGSCVDLNQPLQFASATHMPDSRSGAEEYTAGLDDVDMAEVERRLDGALAGLDALPSDQMRQSSSVWEDGERYWRQDSIGVATSSSIAIYVTPKKVAESPRRIQQTPKSLYDSDGFLKT